MCTDNLSVYCFANSKWLSVTKYWFYKSLSLWQVQNLISINTFIHYLSFLVGTVCSFKIIAGCKSGHTHARVCVRQLLQCSLGVLGPWGIEPKVKLPSFNSIKCTLWCVIAIIPFYGFERRLHLPFSDFKH